MKHAVDAAQQQRKEAFTKYFPNVSGTGLWFNANKGMAKMDMNPSEFISPELGATMAQMLPVEALAALGTPISMTMLKNGTIAGVTAVQPVFAGGQIINGNKLAKVGEDVSRLQLQLSENEVEKQTEQYYWQLVSLQEKTKTVEAVQALLADIYKDIDVAVRAGVAMRNDLLQVQLRQNEVESQKVKLQNGINVLRLLLAQYCGLNNSAFRIESVEYTDGSSIQVIKQDCEQALPGTAEYQLLNKQVEATKLQSKMEVGMQNAWNGVQESYQQLQLAQRSIEQAEENLRLNRDYYRAGTSRMADLLEAQLLYQQACDKRTDAFADHHIKLLEYRHSVGQ